MAQVVLKGQMSVLSLIQLSQSADVTEDDI